MGIRRRDLDSLSLISRQKTLIDGVSGLATSSRPLSVSRRSTGNMAHTPQDETSPNLLILYFWAWSPRAKSLHCLMCKRLNNTLTSADIEPYRAQLLDLHSTILHCLGSASAYGDLCPATISVSLHRRFGHRSYSAYHEEGLHRRTVCTSLGFDESR